MRSLSQPVSIGPRQLAGDLVVPDGAEALVLFAHGSGSSRFSPRNRFVAETLQSHGLATLLLDLLPPSEADDRRRVFDIPRLAARVLEALDWCEAAPALRAMRVGLFGASTGAAAALVAAAFRPETIAAVVSRGGRPDLAGNALPAVQAPTLLIVGGDDTEVLALNRAALSQMGCDRQLQVVAGATHLFEEPGALEAVAGLAAAWFERHLLAVAA